MVKYRVWSGGEAQGAMPPVILLRRSGAPLNVHHHQCIYITTATRQ